MYKVDISEYTITGRGVDKETGEIKVVTNPYDVKVSLVSMLFHPDLRLEAKELLERDKLANKINDCEDGFVLLEDADYEKVKGALGIITGFSRNDVEFVRRILEAEKAEVVEK